MESSTSDEELKKLKWAELVLFLSDIEYLDERKLKYWSGLFSRTTVAVSKDTGRVELPDNIHIHLFESDMVRSEVWNRLVDKARTKWMLFLEDDESIRVGSFPQERSLKKNLWTPAIIRQNKEDSSRQFYQMRMINTKIKGSSEIFEGQNLPDCTSFIRGKNIELANQPIIIERQSDPIAHVDISEELSVKKHSPKLYLVQGERYLKEKKYVRAAAQYRQLLKKKKLLPYDRLAAVNGLASSLTEQHKWTKALTLTEESLKAESLQSLPYLIQFKIYELQKKWQDAYKSLMQYYERISLHSKANFDRTIDEEQTLINLANVALKAGSREKAAEHFEKLFTFQRGNIARSLLKKVLVLSTELQNYERSVHLFDRMFGDKIPDGLNTEDQQELDDMMKMFMKRGWYDYASQVYTELHNAYPNNREYKRKLIVSLTKIDQMDKAKSMVANIV